MNRCISARSHLYNQLYAYNIYYYYPQRPLRVEIAPVMSSDESIAVENPPDAPPEAPTPLIRMNLLN